MVVGFGMVELGVGLCRRRFRLYVED